MKNINKEKPQYQLFKKGDLVKFNVISDDSDFASNCFGVEPQNDWFDIQVYVEEIFGEIVKKNTIEHIYTNGTRSGVFYRIVNGVIKSEYDKLINKKEQYKLKLSDVFEGSGLRTINDFKEIKKINFIPLQKKYKKGFCIKSAPEKSVNVRVWFREKIGYTNPTTCYFKDGLWYDSNSNKKIYTIDEFSKWEKPIDAIYINGRTFVEDIGI